MPKTWAVGCSSHNSATLRATLLVYGRVHGRSLGYVSTWVEFAHAEPGLAAFARERMEGRIVYQATLRLDGAPRVHPVSPWIGDGLLCVSFRDTSPKMREVARDPRYALHTAQPWEDHAGDFGEFMARGLLEQISR